MLQMSSEQGWARVQVFAGGVGSVLLAAGHPSPGPLA